MLGGPTVAVPRDVRRRIRPAEHDDLDDLVKVELRAFVDVYGPDPGPEQVRTVRVKYERRLELLGDWIRVLPDPRGGIVGMVVCCPSDRSGSDFLHLSMTTEGGIREAYSGSGRHIYIVNVAMLPNGCGASSFDLFEDVLALCTHRGIERAYFESRLPGLTRWARRRAATSAVAPAGHMDELVVEYVRTTRLVNGAAKPLDRLLSRYLDFGCRPLCIVKGAWLEDEPSQTYGVLCEYVNRNLVREPAAPGGGPSSMVPLADRLEQPARAKPQDPDTGQQGRRHDE